MGCVTATAKRRRKQAVNGFRHIAKRQRPRFKVRTLDAAKRNEERLRERQQAIRSRSGKIRG